MFETSSSWITLLVYVFELPLFFGQQYKRKQVCRRAFHMRRWTCPDGHSMNPSVNAWCVWILPQEAFNCGPVLMMRINRPERFLKLTFPLLMGGWTWLRGEIFSLNPDAKGLNQPTRVTKNCQISHLHQIAWTQRVPHMDVDADLFP